MAINPLASTASFARLGLDADPMFPETGRASAPSIDMMAQAGPPTQSFARLGLPPAAPAVRGVHQAMQQPVPMQQPSQFQQQPFELEDQSLLDYIGNDLLLGGLSKAANLLDVPGAMVRNLLTGKHSVIEPLLNPTNGVNRATGRDILEMFGVQKNKETGMAGWWDDPLEGIRDIAGFMTEVVTDPFAAMSFGAKAATNAGRVMQRAGLMDVLPDIATRVRPKTMTAADAAKKLSVDDVLAYSGDDATAAISEAASNLGVDLTQKAKSKLDDPEIARVLQDADIIDTIPDIAVKSGKGKMGPREASLELSFKEVFDNVDDVQRGAIADAAQTMGLNVDDLMGDKLAGALGFGLPLGRPRLVVGQAGKRSRQAAKMADAAANAWKASSVGRLTRTLFDSRVRNETTKHGQAMAEAITDELVGMNTAKRRALFDLSERMGDIYDAWAGFAGDKLKQRSGEFVEDRVRQMVRTDIVDQRLEALNAPPKSNQFKTEFSETVDDQFGKAMAEREIMDIERKALASAAKGVQRTRFLKGKYAKQLAKKSKLLDETGDWQNLEGFEDVYQGFREATGGMTSVNDIDEFYDRLIEYMNDPSQVSKKTLKTQIQEDVARDLVDQYELPEDYFTTRKLYTEADLDADYIQRNLDEQFGALETPKDIQIGDRVRFADEDRMRPALVVGTGPDGVQIYAYDEVSKTSKYDVLRPSDRPLEKVGSDIDGQMNREQVISVMDRIVHAINEIPEGSASTEARTRIEEILGKSMTETEVSDFINAEANTDFVNLVHDLARKQHEAIDGMRNSLVDLGWDVGMVESALVRYFPRTISDKLPRETNIRFQKLGRRDATSLAQRHPETRTLPREVVEQVLTDERLKPFLPEARQTEKQLANLDNNLEVVEEVVGRYLDDAYSPTGKAAKDVSLVENYKPEDGPVTVQVEEVLDDGKTMQAADLAGDDPTAFEFGANVKAESATASSAETVTLQRPLLLSTRDQAVKLLEKPLSTLLGKDAYKQAIRLFTERLDRYAQLRRNNAYEKALNFARKQTGGDPDALFTDLDLDGLQQVFTKDGKKYINRDTDLYKFFKQYAGEFGVEAAGKDKKKLLVTPENTLELMRKVETSIQKLAQRPSLENMQDLAGFDELLAKVARQRGYDGIIYAPRLKEGGRIPVSVMRITDQRGLHAYDVAKRSQAHMRKVRGKAAERLKEGFPEQFAEPTRVYPKDSLEEFAKYTDEMGMLNVTGKAIHQLFSQSLVARDGIPLIDAFRSEGLGMDPVSALAYFKRTYMPDVEDIGRLMVDPDAVTAAKGTSRAVASPEWKLKLDQFMDKFNRMWKTSVTLPFPGYVTRNLNSGMLVNATSGYVESAKDLKDLMSAAFEVGKKLRKGEKLDYFDEIIEHNAISFQASQFEDVARAGTPAAQARDIPLINKQTFQLDPLMSLNKPFEGVTEAYNRSRKNIDLEMDLYPLGPDAEPLGALGNLYAKATMKYKPLRKFREAYGTAVQLGQAANDLAEGINRLSMFTYLRRKGFAPAKASSIVRDLQFDYSALTQFEKDNLRRYIFPFYSFTRKIVPLTFKTLGRQPGGPLAQVLRATASGRDEQPFNPDYIARSTSIPFSQNEDGSSTYITGLGLAHEDALRLMDPGSGMDLMSRMNPLIKGPMEYVLGMSFFQDGRKLEDMDPLLGRTLANVMGRSRNDPAVELPIAVEQIASNMPGSRFLTTARQMTTSSDRTGIGGKALKFFTGVRQATVEPKTRERIMGDAARKRASELGIPMVEIPMFKKDLLERMSPADREKAQKLKALTDQLASRARERGKIARGEDLPTVVAKLSQVVNSMEAPVGLTAALQEMSLRLGSGDQIDPQMLKAIASQLRVLSKSASEDEAKQMRSVAAQFSRRSGPRTVQSQRDPLIPGGR